MEIEKRLGKTLREKGLTIATAESCTGGLIAHRITNVSGSSDYFEAGFVTYSNRAKTTFLYVPEELIKQRGAVSPEVARSMAEGARKATGASIGLAVTGIAGPTGGTKEKPVGTVYIGISYGLGTYVRRFLFNGTRKSIKSETSEAALAFVLDCLDGRVE